MTHSRRRVLGAGGAALALLAGCAGSPEATPTESPAKTGMETPTGTETEAETETETETPGDAETQPETGDGSTPTGVDGEITVRGSEWLLDPDAFRAKVDRELTITFENVGEVAHNLSVGEFPADERSVAEQDEAGTFMGKTDTIQSGETTSVTVTPGSTGTFPYWCDVPGHRNAGMVGEMTVTE